MADGFCEIGKIEGSISSIDIDTHFPGFGAGTLRFDAVQLVDDVAEGETVGATVGADIDAVGAIASAETPPPPVPALGPAGVILVVSLMGLVSYRKFRA